MRNELVERLITTLLLLPPDWSVVPVDANKRPLGYNWLLSPLTSLLLARQLELGGGIIWVLNKSGDRYILFLSLRIQFLVSHTALGLAERSAILYVSLHRDDIQLIAQKSFDCVFSPHHILLVVLHIRFGIVPSVERRLMLSLHG